MIGIINYGSGNIQAIANIYGRLGVPFTIADSPEDLASADRLLLPGVGAFDQAMTELERSGMRRALDRVVLEDRMPILGICVGMQLLFEGSEEDRGEPGLGFLKGSVVQMENVPRLPQIGWNALRLAGAHPWLRDVRDGDHFYFVHSYVPEPARPRDVLGTVDYGGTRCAIAGADNLLGVQFHPEKSGANGLRLLSAFVGATTRQTVPS
jgi:imidazole glycerol-phosphate synthase subunit HisH